MRIPAHILALLLVAIPCLAQQSQNGQQSQDTQQSSQSSSQSQDESQPQSSSSDKSQPAPTERKRLPLGKQPSAAADNPFPEDISKKAAAAADNPSPDAAASADAPKPDEPPISSSRTKLQSIDGAEDSESRISDGVGGYIHNPKLGAQDIKVGGFYLSSHDYKGAYDRFKEATRVDPENPDAVFGLAEAARGLKLSAEAADNYRIYLDAVPDGPKAKAARKALAELGPGPQK